MTNNHNNPFFENIERVSKLEAAERQLTEAIYMFFEERDALAIHTLVSAAHQILADLGRKTGYGGALRNPEVIKPEYQKRFRDVIAKSENFLKHGDRDPSKELEFYPGLSEIFFVDAIQIHHLIKFTPLWEFHIYTCWFTARYPDYTYESPFKNTMLEATNNDIIDPNNKDEFRQLLHGGSGLKYSSGKWIRTSS